ncbi:TIGR00730 family Rossman fold protein [Streptomyces sp. BR123]|uniref:LOG family protein n=1 Tax=Streptomyces sp. BR123 TaxID=2749828 RepID=UPI0015C44958|nr:TIGR00730 family Rossman fold protein [Streptomyces sp. BR123]NXY93606.1 TIGR00730 family Rossman fold protein [Streptomyces sp. BR123]
MTLDAAATDSMPPRSTAFTVCVYCAASPAAKAADISLAEEVGAGIAARGWHVVWGGQKCSMMGAMAAAVRRGGGHTTGIVPRPLVHKADRAADRLVVVDGLSTRKQMMFHRADAFLVLTGGLGTCEELFDTWSALSMAGAHRRPLVVLDPYRHYAGLCAWLAELQAKGFISDEAARMPVWTTAVRAALDACSRDSGSRRAFRGTGHALQGAEGVVGGVEGGAVRAVPGAATRR